ncbi:hypothetical protein G5714_017782 [Onychostoma macrolepis]|uniref:Uncharacterized protein n=1 Tax=Onychostoma macrolepis TaxID=369639 RepID=A0A7J6C2B6_9TELE|nr:hypothetical protein G5714_017782 [Onychostoma macrolepis]
MRQGQTVQTFLPTSNTLYSRRSVTSAQQVSVCSKRPSSVSFSVAVGRRIKLSPPTTCSFVTRGSHDRRHIRFSPTAFGHRGLPHPNQGRHRLSFVVDDITPSRPSRHPNSAPLLPPINRNWPDDILFLCLPLCRPLSDEGDGEAQHNALFWEVILSRTPCLPRTACLLIAYQIAGS